MDFMFEDDVDEVGSDVEAYCPKCKADTTHVVISKYEDEIRRVQCNPCGDVHSFRKPRGESEEDIPEPVAARKRALLKKLTWEEFFTKHGDKNGKPYEFRDTYRENVILVHPKFGRGYVSEVVSESKIEITFRDARRILVHNRKDIPGSPVGREDDGLPSTAIPIKLKAAAKGAEKPKVGEKKAAEKAAAKKVVPGQAHKPPKKASTAKTPVGKAPTGKKPVAKKAASKKSAKVPAKKATKPAPKKSPVKKAAKPVPKKSLAKKAAKPKKSSVKMAKKR